MGDGEGSRRHTDLRVERTRRRLAHAMVELTLDRGYDSVTIRDLTQRADIGYATFFRHYSDKESLLRELLDDVLAELMALIEPVSGDADAAQTGTLVFRHAQENAALYRVLLASRCSVDMMGRIYEVGSDGMRRSFVPTAGSDVPFEIAANHVVRAFFALIEWWLEHDMPYPPEAMGRVYQALILAPTRAVAFEPRRD
ncbi:MAG TPA: TetR/AcrR family transcriptional regulator [Trueperaceae bacterium]|nr:TetR/AcrR family transcriptional regulator [Trueperaceae bacterium]